LILVVTEVGDTVWAYQSVDKELVPMPELDVVEDRPWQVRRKLLANNFFNLADHSGLYLQFTQQIWLDNQLKNPGAKSKNVTFPMELPTFSLLSTIALSPLPIKMEM
jgi:hypothetical protein